MSRVRWWWVLLALLVILSPLGLLAAGTAWAEWGTDELQDMLGHVPAGLESLSGLWSAPLPDYTLGGEGEGFAASALAYVVSAMVGVGITALIAWLLARMLARREAAESGEQ